MQKKLLSGLFWVLLANLLVKPFWILGVEVGVQNAVGNEVYGFYYALFSFSYIFNILLDLGLTSYNTRNIARHPQLIGKYLSSILGIKLLLLGVYLVATFSVGLLLGYGSDEFRLLALLTLCQFLNSLILYLRSNFEGLLLFRWASLFSVLDRLLMIVICGLLLWGPFSIQHSAFKIEYFVYAQLAAYSITALTALTVIGRKAGLRRIRWDRRLFLVILRQSAPFALLVLLMAAYGHVDSIVLGLMADDAQAGIFAGAFRLLDALTMVAYLVSVPLLPVFSRILADQKLAPSPAPLVGALRLVVWPMMLFAVGAAVLCALLADPLMELLYPCRGAVYVPVFRVLIFGIIPIGLTYIFGTLLTAGGHLRQLNIFAAVSLGINLVVNVMLIPHLGAVGSAWASLAAQSFMAAAQLLLAVRIFRLPPAAFGVPRPRNIFNQLSLMLKNSKNQDI